MSENKRCIICNIYDRVADVYSAPMLFENEECAKRYFSTLLVNNPNKSDYELCTICEYSVSNGSIYYFDNEYSEDPLCKVSPLLLMKGSEVNG